MKLTKESKVFIAILFLTVSIIGVAVFLFSKPETSYSRGDMLPQETITKGNTKAAVYLVEYSDFQCPACKVVKPYIDELMAEYKENIVFGYRHFPIYTKHAFSQKAALFAEAAGRQNKFWEMYDYLFENQEVLSDNTLWQGVEKLELDKATFEKDLEDPSLKDKISRDVESAKKFGVNGTPTFFLNGKKLTLTSYDDLKKSVKQAIIENK